MVERCEDTLFAAPSRGVAPSREESVETKLHRIARKAGREPKGSLKNNFPFSHLTFRPS